MMKGKHAVETGADVLVTECSACRMHMEDGIGQQKANLKAPVHTAQLIAEAYKRGKEET